MRETAHLINQDNRQKGVAILETALLLPLLILLFLILTEGHFMLNSYLSLTQAVKEGAVVATTMAANPPTADEAAPSSVTVQQCYQNLAGLNPKQCAKELIRDKVAKSFQSTSYYLIDPESIVTDAVYNATTKNVTVTLSVTYKGFTGLLPQNTLRLSTSSVIRKS